VARWIKWPEPGEYRGKGTWKNVEETPALDDGFFEHCQRTGYLPTHEGDEPPPKDG